MKKLILVTGGARSGKSAYAQKIAEDIAGERIYLATCPAVQDDDFEMQVRIDKHKEARENRGWRTIEEPLAPENVINANQNASVIMIDCLTLWISNLMMAEPANRSLQESDLETVCGNLVAAGENFMGTMILVTNEVGSGIVPENPLARRFRDLVGRSNQTIAALADEVVLVSCGIPIKLKEGN